MILDIIETIAFIVIVGTILLLVWGPDNYG